MLKDVISYLEASDLVAKALLLLTTMGRCRNLVLISRRSFSNIATCLSGDPKCVAEI